MDLDSILVSDLMDLSELSMNELMDYDINSFSELPDTVDVPLTEATRPVSADRLGQFSPFDDNLADITAEEIIELSEVALNEVLQLRDSPGSSGRMSEESRDLESPDLDKVIEEIWKNYIEKKEEDGSKGEFDKSEDERPKRKRGQDYTTTHEDSLECAFQINMFPSGVEIFKIADSLGLSKKQITLWFAKKRAQVRQQVEQAIQPEPEQQAGQEEMDWEKILNELTL